MHACKAIRRIVHEIIIWLKVDISMQQFVMLAAHFMHIRFIQELFTLVVNKVHSLF